MSIKHRATAKETLDKVKDELERVTLLEKIGDKIGTQRGIERSILRDIAAGVSEPTARMNQLEARITAKQVEGTSPWQKEERQVEVADVFKVVRYLRKNISTDSLQTVLLGSTGLDELEEVGEFVRSMKQSGPKSKRGDPDEQAVMYLWNKVQGRQVKNIAKRASFPLVAGVVVVSAAAILLTLQTGDIERQRLDPPAYDYGIEEPIERPPIVEEPLEDVLTPEDIVHLDSIVKETAQEITERFPQDLYGYYKILTDPEVQMMRPDDGPLKGQLCLKFKRDFDELTPSDCSERALQMLPWLKEKFGDKATEILIGPLYIPREYVPGMVSMQEHWINGVDYDLKGGIDLYFDSTPLNESANPTTFPPARFLDMERAFWIGDDRLDEALTAAADTLTGVKGEYIPIGRGLQPMKVTDAANDSKILVEAGITEEEDKYTYSYSAAVFRPGDGSRMTDFTGERYYMEVEVPKGSVGSLQDSLEGKDPNNLLESLRNSGYTVNEYSVGVESKPSLQSEIETSRQAISYLIRLTPP